MATVSEIPTVSVNVEVPLALEKPFTAVDPYCSSFPV